MKKFMKGPIKEDLKMFKYFICFFLLVVVQLNSCKSIAQSNLQDSNDMGMELILNENYSGFEQEEYILIKNQKQLNAFYGKINRTRKPGLTPPIIDFTTEMILVWCGDSSASNYASLELNENDDFLQVQKINSKKSKDKSNLVVSPFSIYKLPFNSKDLKIEK
ncbi:hypothetical protein [Maribacter stanieri]|uniref:Uncharacterized protein n=1 Tax=Maribacter stanieri TaxID=440514 RepID=A0A1I6JSB9_9FLAO|nr:hypothetical protein [Maribacter stanieri]SFR81879.1 hypothetical protein SAMN04488010_2946 [Maribacter stanieri]